MLCHLMSPHVWSRCHSHSHFTNEKVIDPKSWGWNSKQIAASTVDAKIWLIDHSGKFMLQVTETLTQSAADVKDI